MTEPFGQIDAPGRGKTWAGTMPKDIEGQQMDQAEMLDPDGADVASEADAQAGADAPKKEGKPPSRARKALPLALLAAIVGLGAWYGYGWWTDGRFQISTDDAYVDARVATIAPRVAGYVEAIPVSENASVSAGDPLIVIENGDYADALKTAEAQLTAQRAAVVSADRQIEAARASVLQAEARRESAVAVRDQAEADFARYGQLAQTSIVSGQKLEAARSTAATAEATLHEMDAGIVSAHAQLAVVEAKRAEAVAAVLGLEATRDHARRTLEAATIRAPFAGVVGNLSAAVGDYVTPGKRLLAVAPLEEVYVEANFKETQLDGIVPGASASLKVDAYPDLDIEGRVESIAPASGSIFSLLPPENATGNFTKVVQRVPVIISVPDEIAKQRLLRPGMSVVVSVDTRTAPEQ